MKFVGAIAMGTAIGGTDTAITTTIITVGSTVRIITEDTTTITTIVPIAVRAPESISDSKQRRFYRAAAAGNSPAAAVFCATRCVVS